MKNLLTLLVALLLTRLCFGQQILPTPGILDVVTQFFTTYIPPDNQRVLIQFQKKPGGWFIAEYEFKATAIVKPAKLFWSVNLRKYIPLDYETANSRNQDSLQKDIEAYITNYVDYYYQYNFNRNIFYGYDGWDSDVISALEKRENLTDTLIESLARAYSNYAGNYFYKQNGYSSAATDSSLSKISDTAIIPIYRIDKFIEKENKAADLYRQLLSKNDKYETMAGNIQIKLTNEAMFAYSTLKFVGHEKEGQAFLKDANFSDSLLQQATTMLDSIKKDGILFTVGDNVTYPLWYLQYKGHRKDALVIDLALLSLRRVLSYYTRRYNHSLFKMPPSVYLNPVCDYAIYQNGLPDIGSLQIDTFLNKLYKNPQQNVTSQDTGADYYPAQMLKYAAKNIYININKSKAAALYGNKRFIDILNLPINNNYLLLGEIVQFDILRCNFLERHIYFSFEPGNKEYLEKVVKRGNIFEMTPEIH